MLTAAYYDDDDDDDVDGDNADGDDGTVMSAILDRCVTLM